MNKSVLGEGEFPALSIGLAVSKDLAGSGLPGRRRVFLLLLESGSCFFLGLESPLDALPPRATGRRSGPVASPAVWLYLSA